MIIVVTSEGPTPQDRVDPRFGRAKYFMVYDSDAGKWESVDNKQNLQAAQGAGIQAAATVANKKCTVLITGHCGPKAFRVLESANVEIYLCPESVSVSGALEKYKKGELKKADNADVEGHW